MDTNTSGTTPSNDEHPTPGPAQGNGRPSIQQRLDGKPVLIYGTLIAGALALLLLLLVVWFSTRTDNTKVRLCFDTNLAEAQTAVLDGEVRRVDILIDSETPLEGLTAIQLELEDGSCRKLPEGADNRAAMLQLLGLVELYNQEGPGNIRVEYQRETVPANLLATSTPIPTITPIPTLVPPTRTPSPTPTDTATPEPTTTATPSPSPTETNTPVPPPTETPAPSIVPASSDPATPVAGT